VPTYTITAPDGREFELEGSSPPTEAELEQVFASMAPAAKSGGSPVADAPQPEPMSAGDMLSRAVTGGAFDANQLGEFAGKLYEGTIGTIPAAAKLGWEMSHPDPGRRAAAAAGAYEAAKAASADQFTKAGEALGQGPADDVTEMVTRAVTGGALGANQLEAAGHAAAGAIPMVGPAAAAAGEEFASGNVAGGGGATVALLAPTVASKVASPVVSAVAKTAAKTTRDMSEFLARSAVKPLVSSMKRVAGASSTGVEVQAQKLVRFIIDERIATPEKAAEIIGSSERELQRLLAVKNAPTDAATRSQRYLEILEKNAAKAGLNADNVAALKSAQRELLEGPMGRDAFEMATGPDGKTELVKVREARPEVPAAEALESARASSKWQTRRAWGEQKGASMEATKAVERAQRDAVKAAVPESKPILRRQGNAIQAREALDRMAFREANREPAGLAGSIVGAGEVVAGKAPVMGMALELLRSGKLHGSFKLDSLSKALTKAVETNNAPQAAFILGKVGVRVSPKDLKPVPVSSLPKAADSEDDEDTPRAERVATR